MFDHINVSWVHADACELHRVVVRVSKKSLTWMRCEGKVTTATDSEDLSKARSP